MTSSSVVARPRPAVAGAGRSPASPRPVGLRIWVAVAAALAALAALAGLGARATHGARTSADEPYYLLTADSLAADGDLDIADELAARAYLPYHAIPVDPQTTPLDGTGRRLSPHDPLLPLLLTPAIALPDGIAWAAAKATLALLAGLLAALTTWVAVARFGVRPATAGIVIGGLHAGMPLSAYGTQVYPEVPAALAAMTAVALITSPTLRARHVAGAALAVVALPWLSVKYVPVAAALAVAGGIRSWRGSTGAVGPSARRLRRAVLAAAAGLALCGVAYVVAHQLLYGGLTVYAAGDHFTGSGELGVVGFAPDHVGRTRRLVGLLVDGEFGIAAWSPAWLAGPAAVAWAVARRLPGRGLILAPLAAGWATATWVALTMHGWWSPGRQVVVVLPLLAVLLARLADDVLRPGRVRRIAGVALLAAGPLSWLWLAVEATTGRLALIVDFTATSNAVHRVLAVLMPAGRAGGPAADLGLTLWAALLAGSAWLAVRAARRQATLAPASAVTT